MHPTCCSRSRSRSHTQCPKKPVPPTTTTVGRGDPVNHNDWFKLRHVKTRHGKKERRNLEKECTKIDQGWGVRRSRLESGSISQPASLFASTKMGGHLLHRPVIRWCFCRSLHASFFLPRSLRTCVCARAVLLSRFFFGNSFFMLRHVCHIDRADCHIIGHRHVLSLAMAGCKIIKPWLSKLINLFPFTTRRNRALSSLYNVGKMVGDIPGGVVVTNQCRIGTGNQRTEAKRSMSSSGCIRSTLLACTVQIPRCKPSDCHQSGGQATTIAVCNRSRGSAMAPNR